MAFVTTGSDWPNADNAGPGGNGGGLELDGDDGDDRQDAVALDGRASIGRQNQASSGTYFVQPSSQVAQLQLQPVRLLFEKKLPII